MGSKIQYESNDSFIVTQLNPNGKKTNDSVVRALAYATRKSWYNVYDSLFAIGRQYGLMPNDKKCWQRYLKELNAVKYNQPFKANSTKYTIIEGCKELFPTGVYIVTMPNNMTCVIDGIIYDSFDCSNKYILNYWKIE